MEERRKITIEFTFERATKNTFRYQEVVETGYPPKVRSTSSGYDLHPEMDSREQNPCQAEGDH